MDTFWKLFKESYIIQGAIALVMVVTIIVMYLMDKNVPEPLVNFVALVLGFYFGNKAQGQITKG